MTIGTYEDLFFNSPLERGLFAGRNKYPLQEFWKTKGKWNFGHIPIKLKLIIHAQTTFAIWLLLNALATRRYIISLFRFCKNNLVLRRFAFGAASIDFPFVRILFSFRVECEKYDLA